MKIRRLITVLTFSEDDRQNVVLGSAIRIASDVSRLRLVPGTVGSDDVTQTARSRLLSLGSLRRWLGFEVVGRNWLNRNTGEAITTMRFRLTNGSTIYWWNGTAWAVPAEGEWNTEDEIAANISSFSIAVRSLAVLVNLTTTNANFSPSIEEIRLAWESDVEFSEDLIFRSLIPALQTNILPIGRAEYTMPMDSSVFPIDSLVIETGYRIVSIDSVFDRTNDPGMVNDLFQNYDIGTHLITLTQEVPGESILRVNFVYSPETAETTSQDYEEVALLPALIVRDVTTSAPSASFQGQRSCARRSTGDAIVLPAPSHVTLNGILEVRADKVVDRRRIEDQILSFFRNNPTLRSTGIDESYSVLVTDEFESVGDPGQNEIHVSQCRFKIMNALFWLKDAYDDRLASNLVFGTSVRANAIDTSLGVPSGDP